MIKTKFQTNIDIINQSAQQFELFLNQVKPKNIALQIKNIKSQQPNQHLIPQINSSKTKNIDIMSKLQDFYENKSEFKTNLRKNWTVRNNQLSIEDDSNQCKFEIRNLDKINPGPNQFFQQDKIVKQTSSQLIEIRSGKELPSWLFDHIRRSNASKLKNVYLNQDLQRQSKIMDRSQSQKQTKLQENRSSLHQRYLNQSFTSKPERVSMISQNYLSQGLPQETREIKAMNKFGEMRKVSSSFEIKGQRRQGLITKKSKKAQQILINEYEYSYCPQNQQDQGDKYRNDGKGVHKVVRQTNRRKYHSSQKPKSNNYRIRQEEGGKKVNSPRKFLSQRLPTVSEEDPLNEPRKFQMC